MTLRITKQTLVKLYSIILAWIPLLSIYQSFVPGVSLAELILVICAFFSVLVPGRSYKRTILGEKTLLLFAVYSLFITIISLLIGLWFEIAWFHRVVRFLFYIFCIHFTSRDLFEEQCFFRHINVLSWLLFLGIVFQYIVFYNTGRYIRLYGNFLSLMTDELLNINYDSIFSYSAFRPSSFLTEPSHIAQFSVVPLTFNLYQYSESKEKKHLIISLIIGCTVLLSKSLWGYSLLILIVSFWLLDITKRRHSALWYIVVPILLIAGVNSLIHSNLWSDTFSRLDISNIQGSLAFSGRFIGYEGFFQLPLFRIIFGSGFGAIINKQIANSILFVLVGEGIIGILLLGITLFSIMFNAKNEWRRTLCAAFSLLLTGSNIFFSLSIVPIFSILLNTSTGERECSKQY